MSQAKRCPDCGRWNDGDREFCENCNHPLGESVPRAGASTPPGAAAAPGSAPPPAPKPEAPPVVVRRRRPRPKRATDSQTGLQLWLIFGSIMVAVVLYTAVRSNVERSHQGVEGADMQQQERANALFEALARDSNNVDVQRQLGDVLYDTANWSEAIVHYRAAIRRDSSQVTAIVDLGVCYFNLGQTDEAERLFQIALAKDPKQNVALFNLGIVSETRDRSEEALRYYHQALETNPPDQLREVLQQRITALMQKLGRTAPALPSGR